MHLKHLKIRILSSFDDLENVSLCWNTSLSKKANQISTSSATIDCVTVWTPPSKPSAEFFLRIYFPLNCITHFGQHCPTGQIIPSCKACLKFRIGHLIVLLVVTNVTILLNLALLYTDRISLTPLFHDLDRRWHWVSRVEPSRRLASVRGKLAAALLWKHTLKSRLR